MTRPDDVPRRTAGARRPAAGKLQGAYYLLTGVGPMVAYRPFEALTGPKHDRWLVRMVALLTALIGGVLATDARRRSPTTAGLGIGSALAYAAIDTWYGGVRHRISRVYLLDALVELGLVALWLGDLRRKDAR